MVPLKTLLALNNASANGVAWVVKSCYTSFQLGWPKECSSVFDNAISVMLHIILIVLT